jgi:raffinose/stachyose/melibiose transport system substrate-binding protein
MKINQGMLGAALLLVGFVVSLIHVLRPVAVDESGEKIAEENIVHVLHWQLEPGFREALEGAIQSYNELPHVREQGYRVQQMAVTERVYRQFLNVHLISGTAPDIATKGMATLATQTAQFFEPLNLYIEEPNPYNAPELLPPDLDPELVKLLSQGPWRETFTDGMDGGLDQLLNSHYAVPVSGWGAIRLFYNKTIFAKAKNILEEALALEPLPEWISHMELRTVDGKETGYVTMDDNLRAWAATDEPPMTLGRLLLMCEAIRELARRENTPLLVPIAASTYSVDTFIGRYLNSFTNGYSSELDYNLDSEISFAETMAGWKTGVWDFQDERMVAFYESMRVLAEYFTTGFLGLDREQANRRFVLGNAGMLASGGWDAEGIFRGSRQKSDPEERFEVGVVRFPSPGPGERWHGFAPYQQNEAQNSLGVPLAIYKLSPNKDRAIDFLRYLTSAKVNESFNRAAGWIPAVIGAEPSEQMKPFRSAFDGVKGSTALNFGAGTYNTIYKGQLYLYISNDAGYDDFINTTVEAMNDQRIGIYREWIQNADRSHQLYRGLERNLSVDMFSRLRQEENTPSKRYYSILERSALGLNNTADKRLWFKHFPDQPFPHH